MSAAATVPGTPDFISDASSGWPPVSWFVDCRFPAMIGCKSISTIGKEYGLPERRRDILIMTGLLILAVGLRIYGLGWGLPEVFEEATPLKKAWKMWGWDRDGGIDLNPHFFNYPSLVIYLHFLLTSPSTHRYH